MDERREVEGRDGDGDGGEEEQEEGEGRRRRRAVCATPLFFRAKKATTVKRVGVLSLSLSICCCVVSSLSQCYYNFMRMFELARFVCRRATLLPAGV